MLIWRERSRQRGRNSGPVLRLKNWRRTSRTRGWHREFVAFWKSRSVQHENRCRSESKSEGRLMAKRKADSAPVVAPTIWQNRITRYGEAAPDQLLANPRNWRTHPQAQQIGR